VLIKIYPDETSVSVSDTIGITQSEKRSAELTLFLNPALKVLNLYVNGKAINFTQQGEAVKFLRTELRVMLLP
jgi:hypothetical protein